MMKTCQHKDTMFKSHVVQFTMNKPLIDKTLDGRKVNMVVTRKTDFNGIRWIEKQKILTTAKKQL